MNFCSFFGSIIFQVDEIRKSLGPLPEKLSIYCSDACIARYLVARNWNIKKTLKMLKQSLKWRAEYKPEEIRWVSFFLDVMHLVTKLFYIFSKIYLEGTGDSLIS